MIADAVSITFDPLVPLWVIAVLAALAVTVSLFALIKRVRGGWFRFLAFAVLTALLANPTLIAEQRERRDDIAVLAIDRSASQLIQGRPARTDQALTALRERLARLKNLEVREVTLSRTDDNDGTRGTRLLEAMRRTLSDIPSNRLAGVIAVTDGAIHDAEETLPDALAGAPLHVLLTGERDEIDRRIRIENAPTFAMVGKRSTLTVQVIDASIATGTPVDVTLTLDGEKTVTHQVPANQPSDLEVEIEHGGQSVVEVSVAPGLSELTLENNRTAITINGIRDRLRVLLVSGAPHAGERTWRDILKSDPSVDLVHFTILRPPEKQDGTPVRELSLIAFPVRELFQVKLKEFDLIIFDQYRRRGVLPRAYMRNITKFVEEGGALLEASGPTFAGRLSIARTPVGAALPAKPTGGMVEQGFKPRITEIGRRHPVTSGLDGSASSRNEEPGWGRWFRQIEAEPSRGHIVMSGVAERPLLILDRFGEGRVAHLLSDHIWLWSRGFEGGGPQAELLRRTAHWLMREPDLEEDDLRALADGTKLQIRRRQLQGDLAPVTITGPDGFERQISLSESSEGAGQATLDVDRPGLYRVSDGTVSTLVAVGALNPLELSDVATQEQPLSPLVEHSEGSFTWLAEAKVPTLRKVGASRQKSGREWIGLVENGDYAVTGIYSLPAIPALLAFLLAAGLLVAAWRREGS